jgi:hypothetical protein
MQARSFLQAVKNCEKLEYLNKSFGGRPVLAWLGKLISTPVEDTLMQALDTAYSRLPSDALLVRKPELLMHTLIQAVLMYGFARYESDRVFEKDSWRGGATHICRMFHPQLKHVQLLDFNKWRIVMDMGDNFKKCYASTCWVSLVPGPWIEENSDRKSFLEAFYYVLEQESKADEDDRNFRVVSLYSISEVTQGGIPWPTRLSVDLDFKGGEKPDEPRLIELCKIGYELFKSVLEKLQGKGDIVTFASLSSSGIHMIATDVTFSLDDWRDERMLRFFRFLMLEGTKQRFTGEERYEFDEGVYQNQHGYRMPLMLSTKNDKESGLMINEGGLNSIDWLALLYRPFLPEMVNSRDPLFLDSYTRGSHFIVDLDDSQRMKDLLKTEEYRAWLDSVNEVDNISPFRQQRVNEMSFRMLNSQVDTQTLKGMGLSEEMTLLVTEILEGMAPPKQWEEDWAPGILPPKNAPALSLEIGKLCFTIINVNGRNTTRPQIMQSLIDAMNNNFAFIRERNAILRRVKKESTGEVDFEFMPKGDFCSTYSDLEYYITMPKKDKNNKDIVRKEHVIVPNYWLLSKGKREYFNVIFNPNPEVKFEGYLNSWRGLAWSPEELASISRACLRNRSYGIEKSPVSFFQSHLFHVICKGNIAKYFFLTFFICKKLRQPWWKPETCFVFSGHEGNGKSTFVEILLKIFHKYGIKCTDVERMLGKYNSLFVDKLLIFLDEASYQGNSRAQQQLKNWLTSALTIMELKFQEAKEKKEYGMMMMATNDKVVIQQGRDCRRYALYETGDNRSRGNRIAHQKYFELIYKFEAPGYEKYLPEWFSQFYNEELYPTEILNSYGNFSAHKLPSECIKVMEDQKIYSMLTVTKFWYLCLERGYTYMPSSDWLLNSLQDIRSIPIPQEEDNEPALLKPFRDRNITTEELAMGRLRDDLMWEESKYHDKLRALTEEEITVAKLMEVFRNPAWVPGRSWLSVQCMSQAYEAYTKAIEKGVIKSSRAPGNMMEQVDYKAFLLQTKEIFGGDGVLYFYYNVENRWKLRSTLRRTAQSEEEWETHKKNPHFIGYADEISTKSSMGYFGSLEEAQQAFYIHQGIDVTLDKRFLREDLEDRDNIPRDLWVKHDQVFNFATDMKEMYARARSC